MIYILGCINNLPVEGFDKIVQWVENVPIEHDDRRCSFFGLRKDSTIVYLL